MTSAYQVHWKTLDLTYSWRTNKGGGGTVGKAAIRDSQSGQARHRKRTEGGGLLQDPAECIRESWSRLGGGMRASLTADKSRFKITRRGWGTVD